MTLPPMATGGRGHRQRPGVDHHHRLGGRAARAEPGAMGRRQASKLAQKLAQLQPFVAVLPHHPGSTHGPTGIFWSVFWANLTLFARHAADLAELRLFREQGRNPLVHQARRGGARPQAHHGNE